MAKKSIASLTADSLQGKRVLVRVDFNVPLDAQGQITDDTRIRAALPTIRYLADAGAKVLLCSHLGRPISKNKETGEVTIQREGNSLAPAAERLGSLLGQPVPQASDCIGPAVAAAVEALAPGQVILLENVRFYPEEEKNVASFAQSLASLADLYVNDAFGTAHRAHASTAGVTSYLSPCVAGFLVEKELQYLQGAIEVPQRPLAAIIGGSKVSSKISVIEKLLEKCDKLLLGGGMIFTFFKARGLSVGKSLVEDDKLDLAKALEAKAQERGVELLLPTDVVVADRFAPDAAAQTVPVDQIPEGWMGLDIGPDSIQAFQAALASCRTVIWNGPMGVFEFDRFAAGTEAIARTLADLTPQGATTIIGGGDSVAAVEKVGMAAAMSHISTGGGASLELLEGKVLPGIAALDDV
ncbi:MAG: phosphoglycerate kinase [Gloeomargaritaceae cyanobacterium C42_A2020_066]|nr:phosphoglycerate kinase [Gloeomargaritaceae cyanobacterium C42_A2020_066]